MAAGGKGDWSQYTGSVYGDQVRPERSHLLGGDGLEVIERRHLHVRSRDSLSAQRGAIEGRGGGEQRQHGCADEQFV